MYIKKEGVILDNLKKESDKLNEEISKDVFQGQDDIKNNFERVMKEYEAKNEKEMDIYYEENKAIKTLKDKRVILAIIVVFLLLSCISIVHEYSNIGNNGVQKKQLEISEQQKQQSALDAQKDQEKLDAQKEAQQQQAIDEKSQIENSKELDRIKNNFHPWDNNDGNNPNDVHNFSSATNDNFYNKNQTPPPAQENYQQQQQQQQVQAQNAYPSTTSQNITPNTVNQDQTQSATSTTSEWMALKGIARDMNGNLICYIKNGEATSSYHIGDYVGDYVITNITNSNVTVADNDGNKMNLNK